MLRFVFDVDASACDLRGVKEQLAMILEEFGDVHIVEARVMPERRA